MAASIDELSTVMGANCFNDVALTRFPMTHIATDPKTEGSAFIVNLEKMTSKVGTTYYALLRESNVFALLQIVW